MNVIVIEGGRQWSAAVLRAGHRVVETLYDVERETMTVWVEYVGSDVLYGRPGRGMSSSASVKIPSPIGTEEDV